MAAVRILARGVGAAIGGALLLAGVFGLAAAYTDGELLARVMPLLQGGLETLRAQGAPVPPDALATAERVLSGPIARFAVAPVGLVVLLASLRLGRGGGGAEPAPPDSDRGFDAPSRFEKKLLKKVKKQAAILARKGKLAEAADMVFQAGAMDEAADYFIQSRQFVRAAEIRHDQNRFIESAELYVEAEQYDSAGTIFSQQGEHARAAECYLKIQRTSVAAEMFEKAEMHDKAADCYQQAGFHRHAAQAFVRCKKWREAADCLAQVHGDEAGKAQLEPKRAAELRKLVRQAGQLYRRARDLDAAQSILQRGGCLSEAAELALEREQYARAADLFVDAGEPRRAAESLRSLGENEEAARILAVYHRDQGEVKEAAECFEEAGDFLSAGDLYRELEDYRRAGDCYRQQSEFEQAAEMFNAVGDRQAAADCFERARRFSDAAECYASVEMVEKQAELLTKAGEFLKAGRVYHREGMDDEAIKVLQRVEPESEDFSSASALLGDIFRAHNQLGLAVKKLRQALGDAELSRENLDVYYALANVHDAKGEPREAVEIYEKIMSFDYHYKEVEQRLLAAREALEKLPKPEPAAGTAVVTASGGSAAAVSGQPGRYQVVGELGRGGMGIVYKAKDTVLDRVVAYKVLPDSLNENPQALQNFLREAKAAAKLNHPNIVTVYDCGEQEGRYFIAMEYVDGTTLKEIVRRKGGISAAGVLHVILQVCDALSYAHEKKIVHRDIKTANAMWTRDKKAKIMDFGLAKVMEEVRNHTTVVAGTPYYMSPEQTLGKNVDHRTDIYSLGVTIFEMVTGTVPFKEGNIPYHHVHTPPPDIRDLKPGLPDEIAEIVARCLMKDPDARYQSAREISSVARASLSGTTS